MADARAQAIADVTVLLRAWGDDADARADVLELLYDELKRRAQWQLARERRHHTLSATGLVHECYLRLASQQGVWRNRQQFLAIAARMMRRILVDHSRARASAKRAAVFTELIDVAASEPEFSRLDLIALDRALDELAGIDSRAAQLVELRFFAGLTQDEAAEALETSVATAARDWSFARAWLFRRLTHEGDADRLP